jgi:hypothetical protein
MLDLSTEPIGVNVVAGTTTRDLWPPDNNLTEIIEVANTDDRLAAVRAGRADRRYQHGRRGKVSE